MDARRLDLEVEEDELDRRRDGWKAPQPRYEHGALAKYAKLVASASRGAICGYGGGGSTTFRTATGAPGEPACGRRVLRARRRT